MPWPGSPTPSATGARRRLGVACLSASTALLSASACLPSAATPSGDAAPAARVSATERVRERGRVVHPSDGDTFWICRSGDGDCDESSGADSWTSVRFMSVQAMEVRHDGDQPTDEAEEGIPWVTEDQCHAREAADRVEDLTLGRRVELRSMRADSTSYGRLRRSVFLEEGGELVDLQKRLLSEGHALWMPLPARLGEYAHNAEYNEAAQRAASRGVGLWDTDFCGPVPSPGARLAVDLRWDADGNDLENVNGEWVRLRNVGSTSVALEGWTLRNASWDVHTFGRHTLGPGGSVTVHSGRVPSGGARSGHVYLGSQEPVYQNVEARTGLGGGTYLFDTRGNLRAWQMYPCLVDCPSNPGLRITAVSYDPEGDDQRNVNGEYVRIRNTASRTVSLAPYVLQEGGRQLSFATAASLRAGETLTVRVGHGRDTRLTKYWGNDQAILANSGGAVRLLTYPGRRMACRSWRSGSC